MKKLPLLIVALALVLGLSQCNKQESPVQAGEKQYIEVTASNGNDGSKVNVDFLPSVMNLTWEEGDEITVSGGAEGTLALDYGAGTGRGHFSGEIEKKNNGELVFSYRKAAQERGDENPNFPDFNAQDGTETWIENTLYLETKAAYNDNGKYSLLMEIPYAVLKLDLSTLVDTQNDVTIKVGNVPVVTFESLAKADAEEMIVALPADGTEQTYTFSGNGKTVGKTWTLAASTYYTAEGGNAVVIKPGFTVDANGTKVEFDQGNLWYGIADGESTPAFHFEKNQWGFALKNLEEEWFSAEWDESHVSHFFWNNDATEAVKEQFNYISYPFYDAVFFTNSGATTASSSFTVDGETGVWRTLSRDEWGYLIGYDPKIFSWEQQTGDYGRQNAIELRKVSTVMFGESGPELRGLIIMPDDWVGELMETIGYAEWQTLESAGAVFLPMCGRRYSGGVIDVSVLAYYWASTKNSGDVYFASDMSFCNFEEPRVVLDSDGEPQVGHCVRLVR